jgi:hypothetical protein
MTPIVASRSMGLESRSGSERVRRGGAAQAP